MLSMSDNITEKQEEIQKSNQIIIENLFKFIEKEKKIQLTEKEREIIIRSFCSFIIDESTTQEYAEYISAFIVKNKTESASQLNVIREGVVLYTGLKYNSNLNDLGAWNTELILYVDTEILFYFAGYDGEIFKIIANDFYSLIKEINTKSFNKIKKRIVQLKYFPETKGEIERFFKKAEIIVEGKEKLDTSRTAMTLIVNGCHTPAEVIEKKSKFYELLRTSGITEDTNTKFSNTNRKFYTEHSKILEKYKNEMRETEIIDALKYLNYINIRRKGISNTGFENVKFFLITGNAKTLQIASDDLIKNNGDVPLASNLYFLTNKFWFKLNKGFGKEQQYPRSFDIVTKAQIALASQLNQSLAISFDNLKKEANEGKRTKDETISATGRLRQEVKNPEDINEDNIEDVLNTIDEGTIEKYIREHDVLKINAQLKEKENTQLKIELDEKVQLIHTKNSELQKYKEEENNRKRKKEKRRKYYMKSLVFLLFSSLIFVGIFLSRNYSKLFGDILSGISIIGAVFSVVTFFGLDYKMVKHRVFKKR
jgi:hypothetical protein